MPESKKVIARFAAIYFRNALADYVSNKKDSSDESCRENESFRKYLEKKQPGKLMLLLCDYIDIPYAIAFDKLLYMIDEIENELNPPASMSK